MTGIHHLLQPYTAKSEIFPLMFSNTTEQKDCILSDCEELVISWEKKNIVASHVHTT